MGFREGMGEGSYESEFQHPCEVPAITYGKPRWKHWLEAIPLYGFNFLLRALPAFSSRWVISNLAKFGMLVLKKKVKKSEALVQERLQCDLHFASEVIRQSFLNFGKNWLVQIAPSKIFSRYDVKTSGFDLLKENMKKGRGTIIAAMHMGLWESVPKICKDEGIPLAVVVAVQHNPLCDKVFNDARSAGAYHHILHNRLGVRHLIKYLKKGGVAVILSDVDVAEHGIPVPFLGKMASTPSWPAELALRTGAELCLGYNWLEENQIHCRVEKIHAEREGEQLDVLSLTRQMNDAMSGVIEKHPGQWFWMQRRWKTPIENMKLKNSAKS
jgi:KDO2-lipid IV(A) lauroyltransferase